jgi:hypothetical protein
MARSRRIRLDQQGFQLQRSRRFRHRRTTSYLGALSALTMPPGRKYRCSYACAVQLIFGKLLAVGVSGAPVLEDRTPSRRDRSDLRTLAGTKQTVSEDHIAIAKRAPALSS